MRTVQAEPGLLRNVSFGDCEKAGDARLRREQVITCRVNLPGWSVVANREELPRLDEQEAILHHIGEVLGFRGDRLHVVAEADEPLPCRVKLSVQGIDKRMRGRVQRKG